MNFKDIAYNNIKTKEAKENLRIIESGRRHAIRISNIESERINYSVRTSKTKNLVASATDRIAIFANEYIPNHFSSDVWVTYKLEVNGKSYPIVPMNSHKEGAKIIKYSQFKDDEPYTIIIDEPIKEAYLTITIKTPNGYETPYVSNLKAVTGKGV